MNGPFSSFVIFAAMRTGSNFLEKSLAAVPGLTSHGEAFNPKFTGYPNRTDLLGIDVATRDKDPLALLDRVRAAPGLNGFRYFPDHDPRVLEPILDDRSCAKIMLGRNPLESYLSLKIARQTGQWMLTSEKRRKEAQVPFDATEFASHLEELRTFRQTVLHGLQTRGQTAFILDYDDLAESAVLNGLVAFLGLSGDILPSAEIIPQNPAALRDKVRNPEEMTSALQKLQPLDLVHSPDFEPRRGPSVPDAVVAKDLPVLFLPIRSGPVKTVTDWLATIGGGVETAFSQATLRDWMREHPGHRRFTVVRHPLTRAYAAFDEIFLTDRRADLRDRIARFQKIDLAGIVSDPAARQKAFSLFLRFVKANLNGQTPLKVDGAWASQSACIAGFADFAPPERIIREQQLPDELAAMAQSLGVPSPVQTVAEDGLSAIHDPDMDRIARQTYARDYLLYGFGDWQPTGA
ncbi:MAG: nodulation protein NodH [Paracoccaceae bacterium]